LRLNQIAKFEGCQKTYVWESHTELHRFMERLYRKHRQLPLNGNKLFLDKENIDCLREEVKKNYMPIMFDFMNPHDFTDLAVLKYKDQDLEFCDWALANLENGRKIYYTFWD
jgi:hypothetical protein